MTSTTFRNAATLGLALALLGGCGGDDTGGSGGGNACGLDEPDCLECVAIGECCLETNNCPLTTICNLPSEPLFDMSSPMGTCLKVTCESDADCMAPRVCSLERICKVPVCQVDGDCLASEICMAGSCEARPPPDAAASCAVTSDDATLSPGATLALAAVARDAGGNVLPGIEFAWASSNEAAVSVSGPVATGGASDGTAELTARVGADLECTGRVTVTNVAPVSTGEARVVVVIDGAGTPVSGATVTIEAGGTQSAATDATGSARFQGLTAALASVTVAADGFQVVSVLEPGTTDVFLPLPRIPDDSRAGGFRGVLDISTTPRGQLQLGFVGPALPSNLLDFGLEALVGDLITTEIVSEELSLDLTGENAADLPGGFLFGINNSRFTADGTGPRCQGASVTAGQLGCYLTRAPEGRTAGWGFAGQLEIAEAAPIASVISDAIGGSGMTEVPIGDLLFAVLPLVQNLSHSIAASLDITYAPKIGDTADFAQYQRRDLAADQPLDVLTVVGIPDLPPSGTGCADAAVLLGGAVLEGRGIVPLGVSAGLDAPAATDTPDCRVAGVTEAFGPGTVDAADGQIPLAMAPLHSGAEGSETFLVLAAANIDELTSGDGLRATALVKRTPEGLPAVTDINGSFLALPEGTVSGADARITLGAPIAGAVLNRYELNGAGRNWIVYAPSSVANLRLPDVPEGRAIAGGLTAAYLLALRLDATFAEAFRIGSGKTLDRLIQNVNAFSIQQCARGTSAPCRLE
ncbi:MAG: carboxypeptidase regulatory-like domain-containing protein [Myxococcota bacterium]